jgi:glucosamine-6-phosphate deaminase
MSSLNPQELLAWCRISVDELEGHPDAKVRIMVLDTPDDVHRWTARDMADELKANNEAGRQTRWILPCGPTGQYRYFVQHVNEERISLRNLHVFHMDECLDWEGRPFPLDHPFSFEGWMRRNLYGVIEGDLAVPEEQRHFPSVFAIDEISEAITKVGGIDTTYGGIGFRGHIAYNEPPVSQWYTITPEQFRDSKTRVLHLNVDTLIAVSQRTVGGLTQVVPPMAITLGMKDLLSARRLRFISDTGPWKRTVLRVLLFGPTTIEYPVTFAQGHPDVLVVVDRNTAVAPLEGVGNV